jgi:glycerol-3-phosphate acyltransferase PlsY
VRTSAAVTCACWLGAWLLGSIPIGHLLERSQLRRDLRKLERGRRRSAPPDLRALLGGGIADPSAALPTGTELLGAALDTAKVLGLAAATLVLVHHASPGARRADFPSASAMGFLAAQVLTFWQSAALWAGLAAGAGHLWPVWLGFRSGGQAQAPLMALAVRFTPVAFVVAVAGYLLGRVIGGPRVAVASSLVGFVGCAWAGWLWSLPRWWGFTYGPEVAVWAGVMAAMVGARNLRTAGAG